MKSRFNVPAYDGIPGIMPGIMTIIVPEFEDEEPTSVPQSTKFQHPRNVNNVPKHKRRMMPCNKVEKKKSE